MTTKVFPKQFNREAFYLDFGNLKFRVYKVEYYFSSVGGNFVIDFCISYSDLDRFKKSNYGRGEDRFSFAYETESEIKYILNSLRKTGEYSLEWLYKLLRQ